jgi:hypothetical protein
MNQLLASGFRADESMCRIQLYKQAAELKGVGGKHSLFSVVPDELSGRHFPLVEHSLPNEDSPHESTSNTGNEDDGVAAAGRLRQLIQSLSKADRDTVVGLLFTAIPQRSEGYLLGDQILPHGVKAGTAMKLRSIVNHVSSKPNRLQEGNCVPSDS